MFLIGVFAVGIMQIDPLGGRITVGCHLFRKILIEEFDLFLTDLSGNMLQRLNIPGVQQALSQKILGTPHHHIASGIVQSEIQCRVTALAGTAEDQAFCSGLLPYPVDQFPYNDRLLEFHIAAQIKGTSVI